MNEPNSIVNMPHRTDTTAVASLSGEDYAFSKLLSWAAYCWPEYRIGDHHRLIAEALQRVERGESKRLMICMPPRHGKSLLVSEYFPSWYLGRNPENYIIAASYGQDLADDFGRKVRNIMASPEFSAVFPSTKLSEDNQAAKRFSTTRGGQYYAVGVGAAVTGRGAHLLLIDDPVKNREEADSEVQRRRMQEWYTSTAYTRLMPGGAIVVVMTRWHEGDLGGWLLSQSEEWEVLSLPAIGRDGVALWPGQYNIDTLNTIQRTIGQRDWSALYMQAPSPETGDYFRREWVRYYDKAPEGLTIYGASDYAVTSGGGDYTEHGVMGVDENENMYLLDWWRGQSDSAVWINALIRLIDRWSPVEWGEEAGPIQKGLGPFLDQRMRETGTYCARKQYPSVHNKEVRAQSIRGRMSQGRVFFPRNDWSDSLVSQLMTFPVGKFDDGVDVLSMFGRMGAKAKKAAATIKMKGWTQTVNGMGY